MVPDNWLVLGLTTLGFYGIAGLTWFFSSRPRLFIRVFVPADRLREAAPGILRDPQFGRGMRSMAVLQAAVATAFGVTTIWCWPIDW